MIILKLFFKKSHSFICLHVVRVDMYMPPVSCRGQRAAWGNDFFLLPPVVYGLNQAFMPGGKCFYLQNHPGPHNHLF